MQHINENLNYRQGSIDDLEALIQLGNLAYGQYQKDLTPENWQKMNAKLNERDTYLDLLNISNVFVCEIGSQIIGMAFYIPSGNPSAMFESEWCYIRYVGVNPEYRGRGIGKNLTKLCIDLARETKEAIIALHTSDYMQPAPMIYESFGFEKFIELDNHIGKKYWVYCMKL